MADPDSAGAEPLIVARNIDRAFNTSGAHIQILKDACLELAAGETAAVVGPSGIGKSTLLHILGTLDRPDGGTLHYRGRDVFQLDDVQLARFRNEAIGFVFQFHHLLPEFSALENTMMPARIHGIPKADAAAAAEAILERVGLAERLHHKIGELSGGEQQRVALARALVCRPLVLLADEPTGNLDKKNSGRIHDLLMAVNEELGMTMVVVTHNTELADLMSRRVTILDGRLTEWNP